MTRVLVRQGDLGTRGEGGRADTLVEEGPAVQIADTIATADVVAGMGMPVLPGGLDPRVHRGIHFAGAGSCDDSASGNRAASIGGTTTLIPNGLPGVETRLAVIRSVGAGRGRSRVERGRGTLPRTVRVVQPGAGLFIRRGGDRSHEPAAWGTYKRGV